MRKGCHKQNERNIRSFDLKNVRNFFLVNKLSGFCFHSSNYFKKVKTLAPSGPPKALSRDPKGTSRTPLGISFGYFLRAFPPGLSSGHFPFLSGILMDFLIEDGTSIKVSQWIHNTSICKNIGCAYRKKRKHNSRTDSGVENNQSF